MNNKQWSVGILLFDEVEVLDFAGPFEVFSVTSIDDNEYPFDVKTGSQQGELIRARNGLKVHPDYRFETMPSFDILIIPGGPGARKNEFYNEDVIEWIFNQMKNVQLMTSVCTEAYLLAKAGLLTGRQCTTHWRSIEKLQIEFPEVDVKQEVKFVDEGKIITSGGISAGINITFYIINRLLGAETAQKTAKRIEYDIIIK
ncbi:DJ-1/PfpI family protein [Bacillus carboniphilus]|uniref:DJ-1/PfpI family protein n=1 Tax=Bacillus carboniphilus TaxID=86663 RepID=A0ABY9JQF2_9BACI|nr:DJ-1/PfpI family protein [Bacillus carboniphilus]WLR41620.1 DJ-1/PfpI family protein [Bacillus carboniphilus]